MGSSNAKTMIDFFISFLPEKYRNEAVKSLLGYLADKIHSAISEYREALEYAAEMGIEDEVLNDRFRYLERSVVDPLGRVTPGGELVDRPEQPYEPTEPPPPPQPQPEPPLDEEPERPEYQLYDTVWHTEPDWRQYHDGDAVWVDDLDEPTKWFVVAREWAARYYTSDPLPDGTLPDGFNPYRFGTVHSGRLLRAVR